LDIDTSHKAQTGLLVAMQLCRPSGRQISGPTIFATLIFIDTYIIRHSLEECNPIGSLACMKRKPGQKKVLIMLSTSNVLVIVFSLLLVAVILGACLTIYLIHRHRRQRTIVEITELGPDRAQIQFPTARSSSRPQLSLCGDTDHSSREFVCRTSRLVEAGEIEVQAVAASMGHGPHHF
jgi:hypothetical protein